MTSAAGKSAPRTGELVERARAGDSAALGELLTRYQDRVRSIVRLRLGVRLRRRVESSDILQETFLEAVRSFDRYEHREDASVVWWLSKIAERRVLAAAEHHGAARRAVARETPSPLESVAAEVPSRARGPVTRLVESEDVARIEAAMARLPAAQRDVIVLRDYAGGTWEWVAEQMERSTADAARMLHARALVALGRLLDDRLRTAPGAG